MSEPMSNHEIEDVLSSIRRLVSEDLRPQLRGGAAAASGAVAAPVERPVIPAPTEKLILTPAFRVVDAPVSPPPAVEPVDPAEVEEFAEPVNQADMAETAATEESCAEAGEVVSRLSAAMDAAQDDWESPEGDPMAWQDPDEALTSAPPETHGRLHFSPMPDDDQPDDGLDAGSAADTAELWAAPIEDEPYAEVEMMEAPTAPPRRVVTPPEDAGWADAAEAEVRAELDRDDGDEGPSMFDTQEVTFDEEVLRDLVRDIIREELAGTLGERITRNVRKLVRAEIARALAVREFE